MEAGGRKSVVSYYAGETFDSYLTSPISPLVSHIPKERGILLEKRENRRHYQNITCR